MMNLFKNVPDASNNLLPQDGSVFYYGAILPADEADTYRQLLLKDIDWKNDEAVIFGKHIVTKRKVAWYGDEAFEYRYSKLTKTALPFTSELKALKNTIEQITGESFNSCLLNLYHTGDEGMGWHSDAEKELKKNGAIASVSFGAERKFSFKHRGTGRTVSVLLEHGSLLLMKDETQTHWLHRLPPTTRISLPRINLTFRTIETK